MSQVNIESDQIEEIAGGEFEREPVPKSKLKGWKSFLGMYAGEHAAGTEFMIGPLFLTAGVSAFDLIVGLLFGNLLAVLSWRFLTAEIAVKNRLTLYFQLEKICGKKLVTAYNLANGILFCFLAGSMITVSATAVGIPFDMEMPKLSDTMPNGVTWIIIVIAIGAVISLIASKGYDTVSKAANWMSPVIVLAFVACGVVALTQLEVTSFSDFWNIWGEGSEPFPGQIKFTFWHVVIWSWFANGAMHVGMSDLSVFRFAKKASAGWTTAAGMYVGHYMAWIAAALLYAVYLKTPEALSFLNNGEAPPVAPGPLANNAIGIFGIIAVVLAGWTTANPTIYRAGLAFQAIIPKVSTFWVTIIAGTIATIAGLFPAFAMKLLGFVALYGFILAPVGAVIVFEHFFADKFGITKNYAEIAGIKVNNAVLFAWAISFGLFYFISVQFDVFLSFVTLPAWLLSGVLFLVFSKVIQKKGS
ncbi:purine-cytosine permease family protein [Nonlabens ulvanivorans]|uniref:Membrane protein n=1 Tax=Nonlabens ulvanivorans TaxID=906888 RepID=A0A084JZA0_NONUL|nr:membrane protein [Nonlabens ulvanivorans]KEZ94284.1 membrane protein [Nonlabens ulvanivorans]PRX13277.1 purine-cytosine permease-like protein [Nonlabens ulvanivorans]